MGLGTFAPVRSRLITDHEMHTERYSVPEETAAAVNRAKREGRPVLAVGTTSVRTLESAWNQTEGGTSPDGNLRPGGQLRAGGAFPDSAFPDGGLRPGGQLRAGGAFPEGNLRSGGRLEPDRAFPDGGLRLGGQLRAGSGSTLPGGGPYLYKLSHALFHTADDDLRVLRPGAHTECLRRGR